MSAFVLAAALLIALASPAEAGPVVAAITSLANAFAATALGSFLTTTFVGRLLVSVAISALRAAIARSNRPEQRDPGIRTANTQTGGTTPASFIIGRFATEGQLSAPPMSHSISGERVPNSVLNYVIELGDLPGQTLEGLILDGEAVPITAQLHGSHGNYIGGRYQNHAWIRYYDGTQTVADPALRSRYLGDPNRPWLSDMVGEGICYAILTFLYNRELYTNFPRVRFVVQGIPLYDPRADDTVGGSGAQRWADRSTWAQTDNPMVMIYNILRGIDMGGDRVWGGRSKPADLPLAHWFAAMNACDAPVDLDAGGTEPAYRAGYEVFVADDEPADVIGELLKSCSGEIAEIGGRFIPRVGGPGLPVYFFTDDNIVLDDPREHDPYPLPDETYNIVTAVYPDPAALWEPREAPVREDAAAIAADGEPNVADLDLSAVPYALQVQRIMEAALREERRFNRHALSLPSDAIGIEPLDAVSWTSAEYGYSGRIFEVTGVIDPILTGRPRLALRERDPADSVWTPANEIANPAPSAVPAADTIHVIKHALYELDASVGQTVVTNLLTNTNWADGTADWLVEGSGDAHTDTDASILAAGETGAGATFPTFALVQSSGDTTGETVVSYRPMIDDDFPGPGAAVTTGLWLEVQVRAAVRRCAFSARIRWYDADGVALSLSDPLFEQTTDTAPAISAPLDWDILSGTVQVPAAARFASVEFTKGATASGASPATSEVYFYAPQLAVTVENAPSLVPYSHGWSSKIGGARLLVGSVTDQLQAVALAPQKIFTSQSVFLSLDVGDKLDGALWQVAFYCEFRSFGTYEDPNTLEELPMPAEIRLHQQVGGISGPSILIGRSGLYDGDAWLSYSNVLSQVEGGEDITFRATFFWTANGGTVLTTQDCVRDAQISVVEILK